MKSLRKNSAEQIVTNEANRCVNFNNLFASWGVSKSNNILRLQVAKLVAFFVVKSKSKPQQQWYTNFNKLLVNGTDKHNDTLGYAILAIGIAFFVLRSIFS